MWSDKQICNLFGQINKRQNESVLLMDEWGDDQS